MVSITMIFQFFNNIDNLIISTIVLSPFLILSYIYLNYNKSSSLSSNNNNSNNNNNIIDNSDNNNNSEIDNSISDGNNNIELVDEIINNENDIDNYYEEDYFDEEEYFNQEEVNYYNSINNFNKLINELEEKINSCIESNILNSYGINDSVNSYFSEEELYYSNLNGSIVNNSSRIKEINEEDEQNGEEQEEQDNEELRSDDPLNKIKEITQLLINPIEFDGEVISNDYNNNIKDNSSGICCNCNNKISNSSNEIKMKKEIIESEGEESIFETSSIMESDDELLSIEDENLCSFKNIKIFSGSIVIVDKELNIISVSDSIKSIFSNYNEINGMNLVNSGANMNSSKGFNFLNLVFNEDKKHLEQFLRSKFSKNVNDSNFNINTVFFKALNYINNIDANLPFEMQMTVLPFISNSYLVLSLKDLSPQPLKLVLNALSPRSLSSSSSSPRSSITNNNALSPRNQSNPLSISTNSINNNNNNIALSPRNQSNCPLSPRSAANGNNALSPRNQSNNNPLSPRSTTTNSNNALSPRSTSSSNNNPLSPRSTTTNSNNALSPRSSSSSSSTTGNNALSPRSSTNGNNTLSPRSSSSRPSTPRPNYNSAEGTLSPRSSSSSSSGNFTTGAPYSPKASPRKMPNFGFDNIWNNKSIDMISHLSHELRTPIHSVIASIQLFRSTILTVTQNEYLSIIDTSANTLLELVSNVLDYKRIRSGKLTLNNVDFNLCHIIEDVCAMVSPQAQAKGLQIASFVFIHCPLSFYGDPIRLRQVLLNLLGNGIKYTNKGQVCISVEPTSSSSNTNSTTNNESSNNENSQNIMSLHFKVKDSGIGIKEEHMSKLFAGFSQVNNGGTTQEALGSGLGLAISKDLVELMGGKIWCSSNAAQGEAGCTFHFVIPLETSTKQLPCPIQNFNGLSVLVVDKNPFVQKVLCQYLEGWNCDVTTCSDLKESYSILKIDFKRKPIEVVMIDIDNIEFRDFIQFKEAFNRFEFGRIGLITMSSDRSMVNEMGFGTSKLTKPFRQSHLIACLLACMPEHSIPSSTTCFTSINSNNPSTINLNLTSKSISTANPITLNNHNSNNNIVNNKEINGINHGNNSNGNFRRLSLSLSRIGSSANNSNNSGINNNSINNSIINSNNLIYDSPSPRLKNPKLIEIEQQETQNQISPPLSGHRNQRPVNTSPFVIFEEPSATNLVTSNLPPISASSPSSSSSSSSLSTTPPPQSLISNNQQQTQQLQQQLQQIQQQQQQSFNYGRVTRRHSIDIIMFENSRELSELKMKEVLEERNTPRSYSFSGPSTNSSSSPTPSTSSPSSPTSYQSNSIINEIAATTGQDNQIGGASNSSLAQSPNSLSPRLPTRIMVIDDNAIGLKLFGKLFEHRSEFECHCYNSSEKALAALDQVNPQFIFMDCEMPVVNGFECTKIIRRMEMESSKGTGNIKNRRVIIALTAHNDPEIFKKCLDSGMDDYISKGFKPGTIDSILRKWEEKSLSLSSSSSSLSTTPPPSLTTSSITTTATNTPTTEVL